MLSAAERLAGSQTARALQPARSTKTREIKNGLPKQAVSHI
jgi:hypothetical protein